MKIVRFEGEGCHGPAQSVRAVDTGPKAVRPPDDLSAHLRCHASTKHRILGSVAIVPYLELHLKAAERRRPHEPDIDEVVVRIDLKLQLGVSSRCQRSRSICATDEAVMLASREARHEATTAAPLKAAATAAMEVSAIPMPDCSAGWKSAERKVRDGWPR